MYLHSAWRSHDRTDSNPHRGSEVLSIVKNILHSLASYEQYIDLRLTHHYR